MYRIIYNAKLGSWLVQIQTFYMFWVSILEDGEVVKFSNFDKAKAFVASIGLPNAYRNYADMPTLFGMPPIQNTVRGPSA